MQMHPRQHGVPIRRKAAIREFRGSAKPKARRKEVHLGVFGWYDTQVCVLYRLPQILYPLPNLQPETLLCRASEANVAFLQMVKQSRVSNYAGFLNGSLWSVTISDAFLNR